MSISTITVEGNSVSLVATPTYPGVRSVDFTVKDSTATVPSPFTGQVQVQQWPGADMLSGTFTLPPMSQVNAAAWVAFLMELRGMANAFMIGDPMFITPMGTPSGTPVVNNTLSGTNGNPVMSQTLTMGGWTASRSGLLLPGDYIQVGVRLHRVLDEVNSDASGNATVNIWPTLRGQPTNGTSIITENAQGLFRLATNSRKFSFDVTRLTHVSFPIQEYR